MIIAPVMKANRMISEKKVLIRILFRLRFEANEEGCCCCCCCFRWFSMRLSLLVAWKLSIAAWCVWFLGIGTLGVGSFCLVFSV